MLSRDGHKPSLRTPSSTEKIAQSISIPQEPLCLEISYRNPSNSHPISRNSRYVNGSGNPTTLV
jgi:hypothetical protein